MAKPRHASSAATVSLRPRPEFNSCLKYQGSIEHAMRAAVTHVHERQPTARHRDLCGGRPNHFNPRSIEAAARAVRRNSVPRPRVHRISQSDGASPISPSRREVPRLAYGHRPRDVGVVEIASAARFFGPQFGRLCGGSGAHPPARPPPPRDCCAGHGRGLQAQARAEHDRTPVHLCTVFRLTP